MSAMPKRPPTQNSFPPRRRDNSASPPAGLTIHPHPTLSETIGMAAEAFEGTITDLYMPKKKKRRVTQNPELW